jgi:hypothetical protein
MSYAGMLTQDAVYWAPGTRDGFGGFTVNDGVGIKCRWEDHVDRLVDVAGEEFISKARVFTENQLEYGWLYEGKTTDIDPAFLDKPDQVDGAFRIRLRGRSQNPQGSIVVHEVIV